MRMDRLTNRLMKALQDAQSLALSLDHNEMSPWHLLKALLTQQVVRRVPWCFLPVGSLINCSVKSTVL